MRVLDPDSRQALLIRNMASQVALMLLRSSGKILCDLPSLHLCTFALLLRSWPNLSLTFLRAVPFTSRQFLADSTKAIRLTQ